ncbi:general substrate transporter [Acephala macrosclerotiorum]|nr:general substrate transporter [Acephala macrosclerotiorum]
MVPPPTAVYNQRIYTLAWVASMGAFIFGYDLAFIGTAITLKPFIRDFGLENASASKLNGFSANIVSLLQAGCFFGALGAAPIGDKIGRKPTLILTGVVFCIGSLMQTVSMGNAGVMFAGRVIGGLGVGAAIMVIPVYIAEASPPLIRGRLVGLYEIIAQAGTCTGFWINYGVDLHVAPTSMQWRIPFAVQLIPGILLVVCMILLPESPRWIARYRDQDSACRVLATLRNLPPDHEYVVDEIHAIKHQVERERLAINGEGLFAELREPILPGNRWRITLGVMLFVFQQMAGSNAINYYSPRIFKSIGLVGQNTVLLSTGVYGLVRFAAVCISMWWLVDRIGRTKLLMSGGAVAAFAMWFLGVFVKLSPPLTTSTYVTPAGEAAAAMIYIYAVAFCFSWAGIPFIYASEIFPLRIRSVGMAICIATHWLMNFVIARSVPYMISNITFGTYFVFATCITLSIPFVYFLVPETKGFALEEMDKLFGTIVDGDALTSQEALDHTDNDTTREDAMTIKGREMGV